MMKLNLYKKLLMIILIYVIFGLAIYLINDTDITKSYRLENTLLQLLSLEKILFLFIPYILILHFPILKTMYGEMYLIRMKGRFAIYNMSLLLSFMNISILMLLYSSVVTFLLSSKTQIKIISPFYFTYICLIIFLVFASVVMSSVLFLRYRNIGVSIIIPTIINILFIYSDTIDILNVGNLVLHLTGKSNDNLVGSVIWLINGILLVLFITYILGVFVVKNKDILDDSKD